MDSSPRHIFAVFAGLALLAGCTTESGPFPPQSTTKYTVENTEKFVVLDNPEQAAVTCTGLQERVLPDGRLEIVANVKNRENRRIRFQIDCMFKDEQGFSTGDEAPIQKLDLAGNATEAVRFTAANARAKRYTIRVRQAQ